MAVGEGLPSSLRLVGRLASRKVQCVNNTHHVLWYTHAVVDKRDVKVAIEVLAQRNMLPMLLEDFLGTRSVPMQLGTESESYALADDMRGQTYLITADIEKFMSQYDVRSLRSEA